MKSIREFFSPPCEHFSKKPTEDSHQETCEDPYQAVISSRSDHKKFVTILDGNQNFPNDSTDDFIMTATDSGEPQKKKQIKGKQIRHEKPCNNVTSSDLLTERIIPSDNLEIAQQNIEISYADFLSGKADITCNGIDGEDVTISTPKRKPRRIKPTMVSLPPEPTEIDEEVPEHAELPKKPDKSLGDITKFFSKAVSPKRKHHQCVTSKIKINADVHGSPKKTGVKHNLHLKKSPLASNVRAEADLTITLLDSCTVTLPDDKVKKKKTPQAQEVVQVVGLDNESGQYDLSHCGEGESTAKNIPPDKGDDSLVLLENSPLLQRKKVKPVKRTLITSGPVDNISKKQSVLQFAKSGRLRLTKQPESIYGEEDMLIKEDGSQSLQHDLNTKNTETKTQCNKNTEATSEIELSSGSDVDDRKGVNSANTGVAPNCVNVFNLMSAASRKIQAKQKEQKKDATEVSHAEKKSDGDEFTDDHENADCSYTCSVLMVKPRSSRKQLPLKLKFTKLKSTVSQQDNPEKHMKLSHAQRLVQRAKQTDLKKKTPAKKSKKKPNQMKSASPEKPKKPKKEALHSSLRRSRRQCAKEASSAISLSYEVLPSSKAFHNSPISPAKEKKKRKKSEEESKLEKSSKRKKSDKSIISLSSSEDELPVKHTKQKREKGKKPVKSPRKTPIKKGVRLASIFTKPDKMKEEGIDVSIEPKPLTGAEKAALAVKRSFLLSGLPENIQQQQKVQDMCQLGDYPPLPSVSHVLQAPVKDLPGDSVWDLSKVTLPIRNNEDLPEVKLSDVSNFKSLTCSSRKKLAFEASWVKGEPSVAAPMDAEIVSCLLAEVRTSNSGYPAKRVYKQICSHTESSDTLDKVTEDKSDDGASLKAQKKRELGGHKRRKVDGQGHQEPSRKSTRSSGAKDTHKVEDVVSQPKSLSDTQNNDTKEVVDSKPQLQWTEKYQPQKGGEQLGNSSTVKKLHGWMIEWKHRLDAEMRKIRKHQLKQLGRGGKSVEEIRKKLGEDWWGDVDEDFAMSSDDDSEDDEDENMCNTVLLGGPHGCGKSALVYALAKELGFKVFEVNASSRRNGRQILAQLQEATQSQQLSKKNVDAPLSHISSVLSVSEKEKPVKAKTEKKLPTAFAGFFKGNKMQDTKQSGRKNGKESEEKVKKKRKRKSSEVELPKENNKECPLPGIQKGLNLCSMTLILFEEVEVVFDEDKGFWSAVDNFMMTTKVPIILTTSDQHFHSKGLFTGRMERFSMKTPAMNHIASHLQLICLAEGTRVPYEEMYALVQHCKGDLRRCLLQLQFLMESGGGIHKHEQAIQYNPMYLKLDQSVIDNEHRTSTRITQPTVPPTLIRSLDGDRTLDSEDDFAVIRTRPRRMRNMPMVSDESSCDSFPVSPKKFHPTLAPMFESQTDDNSNSACSQVIVDMPVQELCSVAPSSKVPLLHRGIFSGMLGISLPESSGNVLQSLCGKDIEILSLLQEHLHNTGCELLYSNLLSILPFPCSSNLPNPAPKKGPQQQFSRIKCHTDIWDDSDDENTLVNLTDCKEKADKTVESSVSKRGSLKKTSGSGPVQDILEDLAQMHEDLCDYDVLSSSLLEYSRCQASEYRWPRGNVMSGLCEQFSDIPQKRQGVMSDMISYLQAGTVIRVCQQTQKTLQTVESLQSEDREAILDSITLPVTSEAHSLMQVRQTTSEQRMSHHHSHCVQQIATVLPLCAYNQQQAVAVDYMPVIRNICKFEQLRRAYANKRRFFHYLDEIVASLRPSAMDTLATSFC